MRLHDDTERKIYAAAYVAEFNRQHDMGVHPQFRLEAEREGRGPDTAVEPWETWCAEMGIDAGHAAVALHRKARRGRRMR